MRSSVVRRITPAIGAACLVVGAIAVLPPTAAAETATAVAISAPNDSHPIPDRNGGGEQSKKKSNRIYTDCDQVRAEGVGPLYRGDQRFNSFLDQDGDGIACNG